MCCFDNSFVEIIWAYTFPMLPSSRKFLLSSSQTIEYWYNGWICKHAFNVGCLCKIRMVLDPFFWTLNFYMNKTCSMLFCRERGIETSWMSCTQIIQRDATKLLDKIDLSKLLNRCGWLIQFSFSIIFLWSWVQAN